MDYSGFEDSSGWQAVWNITRQTPYEILPSDETLSLLWITVSSCICDVTSVWQVIHESQTGVYLQIGVTVLYVTAMVYNKKNLNIGKQDLA